MTRRHLYSNLLWLSATAASLVACDSAPSRASDVDGGTHLARTSTSPESSSPDFEGSDPEPSATALGSEGATTASSEPHSDAGSRTHDEQGDSSEAPTSSATTADSTLPDSTTTEPGPTLPDDTGALGAYPVDASVVTRGGTMTFTNVGAKGSWPRRLDRPPGSEECDYKDGQDTWGGRCCMTEFMTESESLSPFDEEMTLILKAIDVKQLAIYQPQSGDTESTAASWSRVSDWDARGGTSSNLWFTQQGNGSSAFDGALSTDDCVGYVMQEPEFDCAGSGYACPDDPGVLHRGFSGSKLVVLLGSMDFEDSQVRACDGDGAGHPGPWVAFVASELIRDGGRKWNGQCNCYSKTGSVGDGCGEINVFEVVMDGNEYSNREFASTGVRSYQAGHVGGAVCGADCERDAFAPDADVVDACAGSEYTSGPVLEMGGETDGCPVWRRPQGDRYFFILLDAPSRTIQVGMIHPENVPSALTPLLPDLPSTLPREAIDAAVALRLP